MEGRPVLLGNPHTLPGGLRARLRLPLATDARGVVALLHRLGLAADGLEVRRSLRFDPRARTMVVATALVDGREEVLGLATGTGAADTVLAERADVAALLEAAVRERATPRAA